MFAGIRPRCNKLSLKLLDFADSIRESDVRLRRYFPFARRGNLMIRRILAAGCVLATATVAIAAETEGQRKLGEGIPVFNGKDLTGLYVWTQENGREQPEAFASVTDGVLRISDEGMGYVATEESYGDYQLSFEFKWGKLSRPSKYVRNSGLLLHGHGTDGASGGRWISSVECQLAQGCEGDFILIRGKGKDGERVDSTLSSFVSIGDDNRPRWDPEDGKLTTYSGRQFWWNNHEVGFKELIDTRGKNDRASPLGEWTKVEATCDGDRITIKINGHTVNEAVKVSPASGKICFQGEGYEIFFRNFNMHALK